MAEQLNVQAYNEYASAVREHKEQATTLHGRLSRAGTQTRALQEEALHHLKTAELKELESELGHKCVERFLWALGATPDSPHKLKELNYRCCVTCVVC
jgi:hypothetical protein